MRRISIGGLLGFVAVFAVGFAALVGATDAWLGATFTLTFGLLFASVLATILRGWRRGGWLGFALFGWGYFLVGHLSAFGVATDDAWRLPDAATDWIFSKSNAPPIPPAWMATAASGSRPMTPEDSAYYLAREEYNKRLIDAGRIGRLLSVLIFGEVGAILGVVLARDRRTTGLAPTPAIRQDPDGLPPAIPHDP